MPKKFTGPAATEFKVRVPEPVRAEIERAAKINNRSLNAEINERLTRSLSGLLEETLMHVYGPDLSPSLVAAYRQGMLKLTDAEKDRWKRFLCEWVDKVQTALEG
jgi:hypothetical protein